MSQEITWREDVKELDCKVCSFSGNGRLVADVEVPWFRRFSVTACPKCGSVDLMNEVPVESSPDDESVDRYAEGEAGIEAIAGSIHQVDPRNVRRFLDVGCHYGFALDIGRYLYGWDVVGVEPSLAGRRGAQDLGLDIRPVHFDDSVDVGENFDLILASEVVEHVAEPLPFLQMLGRRLTPGGTLILTTPASEIVAPHEATGDVLSALGPSWHVFLASKFGLEQLLYRAGFVSVEVVRSRGTLKAAASFDPAAVERFQGTVDFDVQALEPYYDHRADRAPASSAVGAGMATRHLRLVVSSGNWDAAERSAERTLRIFRERHALDLADPDGVAAEISKRGECPRNLGGAAFALAMRALLNLEQHDLAAAYFQLVIESIGMWEKPYVDPDSENIRREARVQLALLAVHGDPEAAVGAAAYLMAHFTQANEATRADLTTRLARFFVDLIARGFYEAAAQLERVMAQVAVRLANSQPLDERVTGRDALFSLGMLALNTGDSEQARLWFSTCWDLCAGIDEEHAIKMRQLSRQHQRIAEQRLGLVAAPVTLTSAHNLEVYWSDSAGMYLTGWALVNEAATIKLEIRVGHRIMEADRLHRDDIYRHYPFPHASESGFRAYVPGSPRRRVSLLLHTEQGVVEIPLHIPDHQLPKPEPYPSQTVDTEYLASRLANAPSGPVLLIGQRKRTEEEWQELIAPFGERPVVGLDIHPGPGVTVVGDAHQLSSVFERDSFAAVYSASVLEHVAAPWLVAAEVAKVLKPGGLTYHAAPWIWPTHAQPNDFWRMSPEGLAHLFGPPLGFEIIDSAGINGAVVLPLPSWRGGDLTMPTTASPTMAWILARKVDDPHAHATWPYDADSGARIAQEYPVWGLQVPPSERL